MKTIKALVAFMLVISLLSGAVVAETMEKSWNKDHTHLYNIITTKDMTLIEGGDNDWFGPFWLIDETGWYPKGFKGEWSLRKLSGDDIELVIHVGGAEEGEAAGAFGLKSGKAGDFARFELICTSPDYLVSPVYNTFNISIQSATYPHPTDYVYENTRHEYRAGAYLKTGGGKLLPEDMSELYGVSLELDASSVWNLGDGSAIAIDYSTGQIYGYIMSPGVYEVTVQAWLMDNLHKEIVHTFTITGEPAQEMIPDFNLKEPQVNLSMLEDEDVRNLDICRVRLWNAYGREKDEFSLEIVQTKGPEHGILYSNVEPWDFKLYVDKGFAAGEYEYQATLTDVTSGEKATGSIRIDVNVQEDGLPEGIKYDNIKPVTTLKAGKTLTLKAPKFDKFGKNLPENRSFYISVDGDIPDDIQVAMLKQDSYTGKHTITGVEAGTYTVRCGLDMFDGSRSGGEVTFTLVVEKGGQTPVEKIDIIQEGTESDPYQIVAGRKYKLKAEVTPNSAKNKKIIWKTDYENVVSVNANGVIQGLMVYGWAHIYAYAADGSGVYDSIVIQSIPAYATKIAMNKKKASIKVGEELWLKVKFTPKNLPDYAKHLHWLSDNTAVAEILESGAILGKAPGKAVIYAYAIHPDNWFMTDVYAKCTVTVK